MAKKKSSPNDAEYQASTATSIAATVTRNEPGMPDELKAGALASDPALDNEQTTANLVAALVRMLGDSNHRIVRRKVKVGGVWYQVEVSR